MAVATVVLLALFVSVRSEAFRKSLGFVFKAFTQNKIVLQFALFSAYVCVVVYGLSELDFWVSSQVKNTVFWFFLVGCVQLFNLGKVDDIREFIRNSLKEQIKWIVLLELLISFRHFSYLVEILIVILVVSFSIIKVKAGESSEYQQVAKISNFVLSVIGITVIISGSLQIMSEPSEFFSFATLQDFFVPILLTIASLPYFYCIYYYITYESVFIMTRLYTGSFWLRQYSKYKSLTAFNFNLIVIRDWLRHSCCDEFESRKTILASIDAYRQSKRT